MYRIRIVNDLEECAFLWQKYYPVESLFDLWQVRESFAKFYCRENYFIVNEDNGRVNGLLPLCKTTKTTHNTIDNSRIDQHLNKINELYQNHGKFHCAFFPGEEWKGRTWMEQNKIIAGNSDIMAEMIAMLFNDSDKDDVDIRYLCGEYLKDMSPQFASNITVDETGYLFYPANYGYTYEQYLSTFAGKSRKKILAEIRVLEKCGISFRYNRYEDLEYMFRLNIGNFGENGYFHDKRFVNAFVQLAHILNENGMLRVVTVLINNEVAAVDMGAIWNNNCVMLAGGTNKNFPGVAKLINLHHIEWACKARISSLDFLCGDFGWKERFHLTPRTLYQIIIR